MSNTRWLAVELVCTVAIPTAILVFGGEWLGPVAALVVALLFPAGFAVASMVRQGRPSGLAVLALASVLITGGIGLLELDPRWFAVKEAAVPAVMGLAIAASAPTLFGLVGVVLRRVLDPERTAAALAQSGGQAAYDRATRRATVALGIVFVLSGMASFVLARFLVTAPSGTAAFTRELGRYTLVSWPVITLPVLAAWYWILQRLITAVETATASNLEDLLLAELR